MFFVAALIAGPLVGRLWFAVGPVVVCLCFVVLFGPDSLWFVVESVVVWLWFGCGSVCFLGPDSLCYINFPKVYVTNDWCHTSQFLTAVPMFTVARPES